ncbi:DDE-type integrase/transposase/recombinase [Microbacterium gorillae]|uniref:DDE-type integrase/transposase/recombinase n=1 Tax=Microbacterium gorillae TaxID=1231063 RepID=UPI003D98A0B8
MSRIPDRVRQLVVEWPEDAGRGAIDAFCRRHGVSRSWFHAVRKRASAEGEAALFKGSTRPRSSPTAVSDAVIAAVIVKRRELKEQGKDHGPLSIRDVLDRAGFAPVPSRSTIARILDREHLVERNKRKRPKGSHQRIRSEFPNQRWQSDGLEVTLSTGDVVVVIEIIDDCTRMNIALHPGPAETAAVVVDAFRWAIARYGRPVLVHTDNGTAFNMSRSGKVTSLQIFLGDLGVKMITGKPSHPKSQGKVERAHQTLLNFIAARNPATIDELQRALDEYRDWYNHHRSHQALPPRTAPAELYDALPKIAPPGDPIVTQRPTPAARTADAPSESVQHRVARRGGQISYLGREFLLGKAWRGQRVTLIHTTDEVAVFDSRGTQIVTITWPTTKPMTSLARQIDTPPPQ